MDDARVKQYLLDESDTKHALGNVGRTKLYELTASGAIRSVKIGRRRFWPADAVADFVRGLDAS